MKGQEWYQEEAIAEEYESKRFSRGGRLIDRREKEAVLTALGSIEGDRVLDLAAGTGRFSVLLADQGAEVVSVDISQAMLREAREKEQAIDPVGTVGFLRGDASSLPFPDNAFDAVIAMRFFHLADDPVAFLQELERVCRDRVVFDTFNRFSARSIYNWALPMGSQLASRREVAQWIAESDLALQYAEHDWIWPYGLYRILPLTIAKALRPLDSFLVNLPIGNRLATVTFWEAVVESD